MRVTSAYANKMLKKLKEEKDYWINKEKESMVYTASMDEEPVVPDYDYGEVSSTLEQIEKKICKIKRLFRGDSGWKSTANPVTTLLSVA